MPIPMHSQRCPIGFGGDRSSLMAFFGCRRPRYRCRWRHGERSAGSYLFDRNGYRDRSWETRAGTVELKIPKLRKGSYFPGFLEPRQDRREGAGCGDQWSRPTSRALSTRSVDDLVQAMGMSGVSKSQVSRLCGEIDDKVNGFLDRCAGGRLALSGARRNLCQGARGRAHRLAWSPTTVACGRQRPGPPRASWAWRSARLRPRPSGPSSCAIAGPARAAWREAVDLRRVPHRV